jgi:hypothetical protein
MSAVFRSSFALIFPALSRHAEASLKRFFSAAFAPLFLNRKASEPLRFGRALRILNLLGFSFSNLGETCLLGPFLLKPKHSAL